MQVSARVFLKEHTFEDLSAYLDWQCNEQIGRYLNWLPRTKEEAHESLVDLGEWCSQRGCTSRLKTGCGVQFPQQHTSWPIFMEG